MQQYQWLLRKILSEGESHDDRTGVGTLSLFGYQMRFDLRDEVFPLVTTKAVPFRWVAEELFWFLRGSTNEHELHAVGVDIWQEWATIDQVSKFGRKAGDLGPVYGFLWRNFGGCYGSHHLAKLDPPHLKALGGIDQIARLMNDLEKSPGSRRHIVSGWDPRECDRVALPPCHTLFQFKVHQTQLGLPELSCHLYARSIDSFLGLPFNIASYALLTNLVALAAGFSPRELIISFGDVHIYKNHLPQVKELLQREPRPLPKLHIHLMKGATPLERLLNVEYKHLALINYNPHPKIEAEVAV